MANGDPVCKCCKRGPRMQTVHTGSPYADCAYGVPVCIPSHTGSPYAQFAYGDPIYIRETEPVCTLVLPVYKLGPN